MNMQIRDLPTYSDVEAAARRIAGLAVRTPLLNSPVLDERLGARVFLKLETLQRTGSFKFRGAYNRISSIPEAQKAGGVVAFSSGNHAQGVAHAAALCGMRAAIIMPYDAPLPKRQRTAAFGGEVILFDRDKEDREAIARKLANERGAVLVPPFDDPYIIAGQGTCGKEIMDELDAQGIVPDIVVVNTSGGGLAAGVSLAIKTRSPATTMFTAEPAGFDDTLRSFQSGKRERNPRMSGTICDSLMMETPGELTFPITSKLIGNGVCATDDEVGAAMAFAYRELKLVVEPGGAIGLACLLANKIDVKGKTAVAILSGGNVDTDLFCRVIKAV